MSATPQYEKSIREDAAALGYVGTDPRLVEGWMRLENGCLDGLSPRRFRAEVKIACQMIAQYPDESERTAQSYGL